MATSAKVLPGKEIYLSYDYPSDEIQGNGSVKKNSADIKLFVDMGVGIGGDVWPAAELFCKLVTSEVSFSYYKKLFHKKKILELGSGNGLVGIMLEKIFTPSAMVITDIAEHIQLIDHNIKLNNLTTSKVESLDWTDPDSFTDETFDVILALECVYREELFLPLIETMKRKCHTDSSQPSVVILGMTRAFISTKFFDLLRQAGFLYKKLPEAAVVSSISPEDRKKLNIADIGIFFIERSPFAQTSS